MNLQDEVHDLLRKIGPGQMMTTAYDTAWIGRLVEIGEPIGEKALEWLRGHQLEDGSWGASQPLYYHDRVICTLAAMNALARRGRPADRERLRRAEATLEQYIHKLHSDPAGETIGFEMIVPTLLREAKTLGALHRDELDVIDELAPRRSAKLAMLPEKMISRYVTVAFSAEMAGSDGVALFDVPHLQEADGSVSHSPSATAYFSLYVNRGNSKAILYLQKIAPDGVAPNVSRFDVFERGWTLTNLVIAGDLDETTLTLSKPHLDFLQNEWRTGRGVCWASGQEPPDGDDTAVTYKALSSFGRALDLGAILHYEKAYNFYCFPLESNPSVSANIHILSALRQGGLDKNHPAIRKILTFLYATRTADAFWFDKWQASPYYATAHAIIACAGYVNELIESAVNWILQTQTPVGVWGYYNNPTAEETAYCLQALFIWKRCGGDVPQNILDRGIAWLWEHREPPYPPLWIGKCLYCPEMVVKSAILSALCLAEQR